MDLTPDQVRSVVPWSGKQAGVEFRVERLYAEALVTNPVWVNLAERQETALVLWMKLQAAPWFAGLLSGDRPGRVGILV